MNHHVCIRKTEEQGAGGMNHHVCIRKTEEQSLRWRWHCADCQQRMGCAWWVDNSTFDDARRSAVAHAEGRKRP